MSGRGPVVAVIDNDPAVCESTRFLLETYGFEVRTYLNGADFLRRRSRHCVPHCRLSVAGSERSRVRLGAANAWQPSAGNHDHGND